VTCQLLSKKSRHVCNREGKCKRGHSLHQLAGSLSTPGKTVTARDLCHLSVFMAVESHTTLIVGNDIQLTGTSESAMLYPQIIPIKVTDGLMLGGSTPHAGTMFPEMMILDHAYDDDEVHIRIFYQITPRNKHANFTADLLGPQCKFTKPVVV